MLAREPVDRDLEEYAEESRAVVEEVKVANEASARWGVPYRAAAGEGRSTFA